MKADVFVIRNHIDQMLLKISRKKLKEQINSDKLCSFVNPENGFVCNAYKTKNSSFCYCHSRINPFGDNHIFKKNLQTLQDNLQNDQNNDKDDIFLF